MQGAPAAVYSATSSGIVRSPISWTPLASWRLTSMITGSGAARRASMKRLGVPSSFRGRSFQAWQIAATFSALTLPSAPARVRVDVDPEVARVGGERGELVPVLGRDAAGEQERPRRAPRRATRRARRRASGRCSRLGRPRSPRRRGRRPRPPSRRRRSAAPRCTRPPRTCRTLITRTSGRCAFTARTKPGVW